MSTDRLSADEGPEKIAASLEAIEAEARARFEAAGDLAAVRAVERDVLGKRSQLARLHTRFGRLAPEQRREVGAWINATRGRLQERADALHRGAASMLTGRPGPRPNGWT